MDEYTPSLTDISIVVSNINDQIYNSWLEKEYENPILIIRSDGDNHNIEFLNVILLGLDYDDRYHNEVADTYEDLEVYLKRKINNIISQLGQITF